MATALYDCFSTENNNRGGAVVAPVTCRSPSLSPSPSLTSSSSSFMMTTTTTTTSTTTSMMMMMSSSSSVPSSVPSTGGAASSALGVSASMQALFPSNTTSSFSFAAANVNNPPVPLKSLMKAPGTPLAPSSISSSSSSSSSMSDSGDDDDDMGSGGGSNSSEQDGESGCSFLMMAGDGGDSSRDFSSLSDMDFGAHDTSLRHSTSTNSTGAAATDSFFTFSNTTINNNNFNLEGDGDDEELSVSSAVDETLCFGMDDSAMFEAPSSASGSSSSAEEGAVAAYAAAFMEEAQRSNLRLEEAFESFLLEGAGWIIPHPDKAHTGGEDAFFISGCATALGVADGVGGWGREGNAALYARSLMQGAMEHVHAHPTATPVEALHASYTSLPADLIGSATACVLKVAGKVLHSANLGDSGFVVIRMADGPAPGQRVAKLIHRSQDKQHYFNCPAQLGTGSSDSPADAILDAVPLEEGDFVVAVTDGVFDNMFEEEVMMVVGRNEREDVEKIAKVLANKAHVLAGIPTRESPFARNAQLNDISYMGGKMDDITVVVARVVSASRSVFAAPLAI